MQKYQNTLLQEGGETLLSSSSDFSAVSRTRTIAAFILSSTYFITCDTFLSHSIMVVLDK